MTEDRIRALMESLDLELRGIRPMAGGDINRACRVATDQGDLFLKYHLEAPERMFEAEARGLEELHSVGGLRVPKVVAGGDWFLALEYLPLQSRDAKADRRLGVALARMHAREQPHFGWTMDNFIGLTPQPNEPSDSWLDFFVGRRLMFQAERLAQRGHGELLDPAGRLAERLARGFFDGYAPHPALLHGDLWSGNAACANGDPVVFDPAVYYGDRETDLAMMELFGGFSRAAFEAYGEVLPVADGYARRKRVYQLYHLLNHANLFGGGYVTRSRALMEELISAVR